MASRILLPSWISQHHPLYLNTAVRKRIRREYSDRAVFLNIPYSKSYSDLEVAIIPTVTAYDLAPRMARQRTRMEVRLQKIFEMILCCRFGLTDLSYLRRMNMPLELGLMLALGKESFVMSRKRYTGLRAVSDLNFCDIHYHEGSVPKLISGLSQWIEEVCSPKRLTTETLVRRCRKLKEIRKRMGENFDRLRPGEIAGLLGVAHDEFAGQSRRTAPWH